MKDDIVYNESSDVVQQKGDGPIIYGTRFLEGYESVAPCFHLYISIERHSERFGEFEGGDWCFVVSHPNAGLRCKDCAIRENEPAIGVTNVGNCDMQHPMFVSVRQLIENRKRMPTRILPSCIWLQSINDCQYVRSDSAGNLREQLIASLTPALLVRNGEVGSACSFAYRSVILLNKTAGEMVEGGSEIMETISKDRAEVRLWLMDDVKLKKNQPWVARLYITNNLVRLAVKVAPDFVIKSQNMLLCPVELECNAERCCHGVYLSYGQEANPKVTIP